MSGFLGTSVGVISIFVWATLVSDIRVRISCSELLFCENKPNIDRRKIAPVTIIPIKEDTNRGQNLSQINSWLWLMISERPNGQKSLQFLQLS